MPFAIYESGLPLSSFDDEPTFRVGSDRTFVVGKHAYPNAMEFQLTESMLQEQANSFGADAFSEK